MSYHTNLDPQIWAKVQDAFAAALGLEEDEIELDARLIEDLGAESLGNDEGRARHPSGSPPRAPVTGHAPRARTTTHAACIIILVTHNLLPSGGRR